MKNEDHAKEKSLLLAEYQSLNQLLYHLQRLQMQTISIVLSGVFLFIGLSFTAVKTEMFLVFFPFVIVISFGATFLAGLWFRYQAELLNIVFDHKAKLEKSLGFSIEQLIQKRIYEKPRTLAGIALSRKSAATGPLWLSFSLTAILTIMYFVVRSYLF